MRAARSAQACRASRLVLLARGGVIRNKRERFEQVSPDFSNSQQVELLRKATAGSPMAYHSAPLAHPKAICFHVEILGTGPRLNSFWPIR
jgi:hypothetical protein